MSDQAEQIPLSDPLLHVLREAAAISHRIGEEFITIRALLLALLDDSDVGSRVAAVVSREKLERLPISEGMRARAARMPEVGLAPGERAAMQRYNTLAVKLPDGSASMWFSIEASSSFFEGAQYADSAYGPRHLARGIAGEALRVPGILAGLQVSPVTLAAAVAPVSF